MKTKECPSCAVEIDADEPTCPLCGYEFPQRASVPFRLIAAVLLLLFLYPLLRIFC